ncbi:MAG: hypothetical protein NXH70_10100 [Hyphomonas sp.]|jgi:predicted dehydrogenase|nr:hypothetical protein [Hyphomonas sp.]
MSEIRIAVIGANQLDLDHRHALNAMSDYGRIAVYALENDTLEGGREALQRAVDLDAIDAAIVAGRRQNVAAWIKFALETGWPVYTPYPVPNTIEEMVEIRRTEQQNAPSILQFGLSARLHDSVAAARSKIDTGEYGQLLSMRGVCGVSGIDTEDSVLFGPGAQLVDIMQLFAGPFQDITGFVDLDRQAEPGSETNVLAALRTHSGVVANLHASATQWRPTFRLELGYERGYLWLEGLNNEEHGFGREVLIYARTDGAEKQHETVDRFEHNNGVQLALDQFLARVSDRALPAPSTSQDAFDTLNTIQRILAADPIYAPIQERQVS